MRDDGGLELMGEIVDKVRAQHFSVPASSDAVALKDSTISRRGGNGGHKALGLYADDRSPPEASRCRPWVISLTERRGKVPSRQGHQGAAHQTDGGR